MCLSGLNITEVAHDYCTSVSDYIINDLHLLNSYDTWHGMSSSYMYPIVVRAALVTCEGTKNVAKAVKKIAQGAAKWEGTRWFRDVSDKCKYLLSFSLFTIMCIFAYMIGYCR